MPIARSRSHSTSSRCRSTAVDTFGHCMPYKFTRTRAKHQFLSPRTICIYSGLTLVASVASPARMAYSEYVKQRIVFYHRSRKNCAEIAQCLAEEGYNASKVGVYKFLRRYKESGIIAHTPGSGQTPKVNPEICKLIEEQMQKNDETTVWSSNSY